MYAACHSTRTSPSADWRPRRPIAHARPIELAGVRELRVARPDTDLRVHVEGAPGSRAPAGATCPTARCF